MFVERIGRVLFSLGGSMLIVGIILIKFPGLASYLGNLPGDVEKGKAIILIGTSVVISLVFSGLSLLFGWILKFIK